MIKVRIKSRLAIAMKIFTIQRAVYITRKSTKIYKVLDYQTNKKKKLKI